MKCPPVMAGEEERLEALADGFALGALCVIDSNPHREFSQEDRDRLRELAEMAAYRLEIHRGELTAKQHAPPQAAQDDDKQT